MKLRALPSRIGFAGLLLLGGLLEWAIVSWPLPRLFATAIPHAPLRSGPQAVRPLAPGEALRTLYRSWLFLDALSGHSPLFRDAYGSSLGDGSRPEPAVRGPLPVSLVYAAIAPVAGNAAGWNAMGLASIGLGVLGLGRLARRFTGSAAAAFLAALAAAAWPSQWIAIFAGAPAGFAMAFAPWLVYGLDRALCDRSARGGLIAALALGCAFATDGRGVSLAALAAPLLAILLAGAFEFCARPGRRWLRRAAIPALALISLGFFGRLLAQTSPGFCRLPRENAAYAAVAADDKANAGRPPHALALPLWPGAASESSLYGYAVMLSRVRLVNGLAPATSAADLFGNYGSLNQGVATDEQLDDLLARGVRHLIVHADLFREEVSPFPAAATLRALVGHPRLASLADDGRTFAFRILPKHPVEHVPHANWSDLLFATSRHWHWDPPLEIPQGETAPLLLPAPVQPAPGLRYLLRIAQGSAQPLLTPPARGGLSSITHPIAGFPDWLQADLPNPTGAFVQAVSGPVALEHALLIAGELPAPGPDGAIHVPPALLFHIGHSSPGHYAVGFHPETVPAGLVLHGPNLPFPPGTYDIAITYSANLPAGTLRLLSLPDRAELASAELRVDAGNLPANGAAVLFRAISVGPAPLRFELAYNGQAHLTLHDIVFRPATLQLRPAAAAP